MVQKRVMYTKSPRLVAQPGDLKRVLVPPDFYSMKRKYPKLTRIFRFGYS